MAGKVASLLYLVIVPFAAAILLTALLQPLTARLRRAGLGPLSATWCTLLLAFALIGGAVWLVTTRVEAEYPALVTQVGHTSTQIQNWLASSPFHIRTGNLEKISDNLVNYLTQHRSTVEGAALTGGRIVVELLAGIVLCFFISFFLIKDGERIWSWLVSGLSAERGRRANLAGPRRLAGRRLLRQGHRRGGRDPRRRHGDHAHRSSARRLSRRSRCSCSSPRSCRSPAC